MVRKKTPPWYGLSGGPMMVACQWFMVSNVSYCYLTSDQSTCQWNMSSPTGPAEHCAGGSRPRSCSSLLMRFRAMPSLVSSVLEDYL